MALIELFFTIIIIIFFILNKATSVEICPVTCGEQMIHFPFKFNYQYNHCGYPRFDLTCVNQSETVLSFTNSGDFTVQEINYREQSILINDPDYCLPKRLLQVFNLSGSPFDTKFTRQFTFLNCSSDVAIGAGLRSASCLSGKNYTVAAIPTSQYYGVSIPSCVEISTVLVPVLWPSWSDLSDGAKLTWSEPNCMSCVDRGGTCGFKSEAGLNIGCSNLPKNGLPRGAKYGIIIGVGIPSLLCFIGLTCYFCNRAYSQRHRPIPNTDFTISIPPQPIVVVTGLDGPTIESYPKTVLGESRQLPRPSDNICPICLCEYQPKETLRTIPECNHYFHANCVDGWLRINATCPLCRKTPEGSAPVTPTSSASSSSRSSL